MNPQDPNDVLRHIAQYAESPEIRARAKSALSEPQAGTALIGLLDEYPEIPTVIRGEFSENWYLFFPTEKSQGIHLPPLAGCSMMGPFTTKKLLGKSSLVANVD